MVYCGKPSRACSHCKGRGAKCDRRLECGQCRRAGLKCSGPRDPKQLVFRDQSQEVSRKAAIRNSNGTSPIGTAPDVLEQACVMFFNRYVYGNSRTYDYITTLDLTNDGDSCLSAAKDAASLGYYSTQNLSPRILNSARKKYDLALRLVSKALQSHDQAVKDSTLASVLLLDLFEKLTQTYRSPESWTKHMNGAVELVKLRGESQFQYPLGLRLFLQLNSTILIGCLQYDVQVPIELIELRRKASKYVDPMDPKWKFSEIVVPFVGLGVANSNGHLSSKHILDTARYLDAELNTVSENVPQEWKYDTIKIQSPCEQVYEQHFHVYADHHMTHTWNNIRIIRILLNTLLREQLMPETDPLENSAIMSQNAEDDVIHLTSHIVSLSNDILASVPQYTQLPRHTSKFFPTFSSTNSSIRSSSSTGHASNLSSNTSSKSKSVRSEPTDFTPFEISRCYALIFPLYIAGNSPVCSESTRGWILDILDFLENSVGIREAKAAAGYLKRREKINPWSLYAKIGSYSFSA
ncbi:hypothetical protein L207DRAFT_572810 [Hyaloscypha variabilis F]|uniref:Zn(2)-C6 fungal-type domain-containing protein n=1 Tax=Hyaloscypha variabilis (strain UAMH 11265 / GT02V1 / F) TaxID=1149755 RepID=A0A2J6QZF1_HYAVF|nr:hypothetical protein L207DRAFT_572810 [Hyaloscypha variabilis F]